MVELQGKLSLVDLNNFSKFFLLLNKTLENYLCGINICSTCHEPGNGSSCPSWMLPKLSDVPAGWVKEETVIICRAGET